MLTVLSVTLHDLGRRALPGGAITEGVYHAMGGVDRAVTRWADARMASVPEDHRPIADQLMLRLVNVGSSLDDSVTRAVRRKSALVPDGDDVTAAVYGTLVDQGLVTPLAPSDPPDPPGATDPRVTLVHDALIHDWTHLVEIVKEARPTLLWKSQWFTARFDSWREEPRAGPLLSGDTLRGAVAQAAEHAFAFDPREHRFIAASRRRRLRDTLLSAVSVLAAVAVVTTLAIAFVRMRASSEQTDNAKIAGELVDHTKRAGVSAEDTWREAAAAYRLDADPLTASRLAELATSYPGTVTLIGGKDAVPTPDLIADVIPSLGGRDEPCFDVSTAFKSSSATASGSPPSCSDGLTHVVTTAGAHQVVGVNIEGQLVWWAHGRTWRGGLGLVPTKGFRDSNLAMATDGTVVLTAQGGRLLTVTPDASSGLRLADLVPPGTGPDPYTDVQVSTGARVLFVTDGPPRLIVRNGRRTTSTSLSRSSGSAVLAPDGSVLLDVDMIDGILDCHPSSSRARVGSRSPSPRAANWTATSATSARSRSR